METIVKAEGLRKSFPLGSKNEVQVLRGVSLNIEEGEFVAVMGPSGSGKSTLLYNLSGMDRPDSGRVQFMGVELLNLAESELARLRLCSMGFVFQQSYLLKNLRIVDNIALPAYAAKIKSKREIRRRAMDLMAMTGIEELAMNDISQASGGQLQRAGICRALVNEPKILFGDEPTGALNSKAAGEVMNILEELNRAGTTILLTTHDVKVASAASRVLYMHDGSLVAESATSAFGDDLREREDNLAKWLMSLGF